MKVRYLHVRRGVVIALVMLMAGCGASESDTESPDADAAAAASRNLSGIHRGLDAVDESRELTTLINARQAQAFDAAE